MPVTWDSQRLRHQKAVDGLLTEAHRGMARAIAALVVQAATGRDTTGKPIIPASRKTLDDLKTAVWDKVIRPFYVGQGNDALDGPNPRSPYALLLVQGIEGATRIQAERQVAIVKRLCKDAAVLAWLTGPRPMLPMREMQPVMAGRITELNTIRLGEDPIVTRTLGSFGAPRDGAGLVKPRGTYDAFHRWLDPRGHRLSDRVWTTSIDVRSRIDLLLEYHVAQGTSAIDIANLLEPFLTPGGAKSRTLKPYPSPYGTEGSYSARRLARTEITAAAGRATAAASEANPFVGGVQWRISGSHPDVDICDMNAHGGPNGDGIYPPDQVPRYPGHPNCLCALLPVPVGSTADLVESLRADIQAARSNLVGAVSAGDPARGRRLQGLLSPEHLTRSLLDGTLDTSVSAAVRQSAQRLPANVRARVTRAVAPVAAKPLRPLGEIPADIISTVDPRLLPTLSPTDRELTRGAQQALEEIGRVHGYRNAPTGHEIARITDRKNAVNGWFDPVATPSGYAKKTYSVALNPAFLKDNLDHVTSTTVHEMGHWFDFHVLGRGTTFASESHIPEMDKLWSAISKSKRYQQWGGQLAASSGKATAYHEYIASDVEVFARAYTQFVGQQTKNESILGMVSADLADTSNIKLQWEAADFAEIDQAFGAFLRTMELAQ